MQVMHVLTSALTQTFSNPRNWRSILCPLAMERQDEIIPEHPNNSNIRCSPQDKRCIQKTLARNPLKSTNQRSNTAREETKAVLVRHNKNCNKSFGLLSVGAFPLTSKLCKLKLWIKNMPRKKRTMSILKERERKRKECIAKRSTLLFYWGGVFGH